MLVIGCWIPNKWFVHKPYTSYLTNLFTGIFHIWLMLSKQFIKLNKQSSSSILGNFCFLDWLQGIYMMYHLLLAWYIRLIYLLLNLFLFTNWSGHWRFCHRQYLCITSYDSPSKSFTANIYSTGEENVRNLIIKTATLPIYDLMESSILISGSYNESVK